MQATSCEFARLRKRVLDSHDQWSTRIDWKKLTMAVSEYEKSRSRRREEQRT